MYIPVILPTKLCCFAVLQYLLISCSVDTQLILLTSEQSFEVIFFGPCSSVPLAFYFLISSNFTFQQREKEQGD